jgi:hypothetical protein
MNLLTHHLRLVGVDDAGKLVQVDPLLSAQHALVEIQESLDGQCIESGPLAGYSVIDSHAGVNFKKDGKFLCAEPTGRIVADREVAQVWETFTFVPKTKLALLGTEIRGDRSAKGEVERLCATVQELLSKKKPIKLNCGSGNIPKAGFVNFDISILSPTFLLSNPKEYFIFPFADMSWGIPDDCIDYIFHEDFIEHITQLQQIQFLAETLRVLKPGCYHRVNTPNLIAAMKRHSNFKEGFTGVYTGELKWGHKSIFSHASLKEMAELVGYSKVIFTTKSHGVSPYAVPDIRPGPDRDEIVGNIFADLQK